MSQNKKRFIPIAVALVMILLTGCAHQKAYNGETINSFSVPIYLKIRHADISRTWTEAGGFLVAPPVSGAIPLIGGICFIQYDDDVTPLAADKIQVPIGDYVAQKIITRIKNIDDIGSSR